MRTSCFLLLKAGIVSPAESDDAGREPPSSDVNKTWRALVIQKHFVLHSVYRDAVWRRAAQVGPTFQVKS